MEKEEIGTGVCRHKLSALPPHRCKFCGADREIVMMPPSLAPSQTRALAANDDGHALSTSVIPRGFGYPNMVRKLVGFATGMG
jgi:hypothetical protein